MKSESTGRYAISCSSSEDAFNDVRAELDASIRGVPKLIFFYSDTAGFKEYTESFHKAYPNSHIIGSTTYIGLTAKGYSEKSLSALAVYSGIECCCGVVKDIKRYPMKHADVIRRAVGSLGISADPEKNQKNENICCFEFITAFGMCEELVLDTYKSVLAEYGIPIFGGSSSGSASEFHSDTFVSVDGEVYSEASVFALVLNLNGKIKLYRENMFVPTHHCFTATDVDCEERTVYEFDGKPASEVLAQALEISQDELPAALQTHPLGRIIDGKIYITELRNIEPDGSLVYYARIYNHTKMALLKPGDMRAALSSVLNSIKIGMPKHAFSIVIGCVGRFKYYENNHFLNEFHSMLSDTLGDFICFSCYGEQLDYEHLNQTVLAAVFE